MTDKLHPIAQCMVDAGLSHIKPSEQVAALEERLARNSDYSIDLARIIEDLCHSREIRTPGTSARFHYDMAVAYRAALASPPEGRQDGGPVTDAMVERARRTYDMASNGTKRNKAMRLILEAALTHSTPVEAETIEAAFVEGYRKGMARALLRDVKFNEHELASVKSAGAHYVAALAAQPLPKQGTGEPK